MMNWSYSITDRQGYTMDYGSNKDVKFEIQLTKKKLNLQFCVNFNWLDQKNNVTFNWLFGQQIKSNMTSPSTDQIALLLPSKHQAV